MHVTEITVARSCKMNLGDYEAADIFTSMKAELEPGDDEVDARKQLAQLVERAMVVQVLMHHKARGKKVDKDYIIKRYGLGGAK